MNKVSSFKVENFTKDLFRYLYPDYYEGVTSTESLFFHIKDYLLEALHVPFKEYLSELKKLSDLDLDFYFDRDPAMDSKEEVVLTNGGFRCVVIYRLAHFLYQNNHRLLASILSYFAKQKSGIEIHPNAQIGSPFFIDHGVGTVIGSTTIIKNYVAIYQNVTLGAKSLKDGRKLRGTKRHPTINDHVTLYCYSAVFGDIEVEEGRVVRAFEKIVKDND